jgi:hypothetical protein
VMPLPRTGATTDGHLGAHAAVTRVRVFNWSRAFCLIESSGIRAELSGESERLLSGIPAGRQ